MNQPHLAYVNKPKALAANKGYHGAITTSIRATSMARRLERNKGK
jgi:hypothetical protein